MQCKQLLHLYETQQELRCVHSNNVGSFYKFVNSRLSCKSGVGVLRDNCENSIVNDKDKAELLNDYFCSVCTLDDGILPQFPRVLQEDVSLESIDFSPVALSRAINKLKNSVSCGPDGIPPVMLKKLPLTLHILYQSCSLT
jgi:hypothetical protein